MIDIQENGDVIIKTPELCVDDIFDARFFHLRENHYIDRYSLWLMNHRLWREVLRFRGTCENEYIVSMLHKPLLFKHGTMLGVPIILDEDYTEITLTNHFDHLFPKCKSCFAPLSVLKCSYCGTEHYEAL